MEGADSGFRPGFTDKSMSRLGQSRRFAPEPLTSGRTGQGDIVRSDRRITKAPATDMWRLLQQARNAGDLTS